MTKSEFLSALRAHLYGLPKDEIDERVDFYGEAIDDRIEDGLSEEDAVGEMGSLDGIVFEIIGEVPLSKIIKQRVKPKRRFKAWETVLLAVGSPVWLSLLFAAFAVVLSLYASQYQSASAAPCSPRAVPSSRAGSRRKESPPRPGKPPNHPDAPGYSFRPILSLSSDHHHIHARTVLTAQNIHLLAFPVRPPVLCNINLCVLRMVLPDPVHNFLPRHTLYLQ